MLVRLALWLVLAGCGRIGFDDAGGDAPGDDASTRDGDAMMTIGCADLNLGSALGPNVASGTTSGSGNDDAACSGDGPDVRFGWFAPSTGMYQFDLCESEENWDSVMYVRSGSCSGTQLACNDDACGGFAGLQPKVTLTLEAGQPIVIVVDSQFPAGAYQLAITKL